MLSGQSDANGNAVNRSLFRFVADSKARRAGFGAFPVLIEDLLLSASILGSLYAMGNAWYRCAGSSGIIPESRVVFHATCQYARGNLYYRDII